MANYKAVGGVVSTGGQEYNKAVSQATAVANTSRQTKTRVPSASQVAYSTGKRKYGSSSAWYDEAEKEQQEKQKLVDSLKEQIKYRELNEWANNVGGGIDSLSPYQDKPSENYKSLEDLQKELKVAEHQLKNAETDFKYASEWRDYDGDMAWLDSVAESGQDWGYVSDNLGVMAGNLEQKYEEKLKAYTEAQKQNKALDDRRGRVPSEVGYSYTSPEQLAQMAAELEQLGELRDMANRRYGYSLDELASNDTQAVERGKLRAGHIAEMEERAYSENISGYIEGMESGQLGSVTGVDIYKGERRDFRPTDAWSEEQLNRYYVILDRQGEEAAANFAVKTNTYNNLLAQEEGTQGAYEWGNAENGLGRGLAVTAANVLTSPERLVSYIDKARRVKATGVYTGTSELWAHDYLDAAAEGRADKLNELGTVAGKGLGDIYKLTNSMAQSLVYGNTVGTVGTLGMFFGQAADQSFDDAMSRGATPEQAVSFGMLSGIAEAAAELVPLENLLNADKALTRGFLKSAMIQAGLEGIEEGETNVMNMLADELVMGDKSAMNQAIRERMEQGESYEDAARAEWGNFVKDTVWSMLGGAISGAGSSTIQYGITMASPYEYNEDGSKSIYGATAAQLGREAAAVTDNKSLAELGKKVETKATAGGKITNYTAKKLAEGTNRVSIVNATEQQVKERVPELNAKDARALANAIVSESRGEKNGPGNQKLIEKHRDIADSLLDELGRNGEVAEWAQKIGVRGVEQIKYGNKDIEDLRRDWEANKDKIEADAPSIAEADMSADVSIGDVSGTVTGLKLTKGKPQFVIKNSEGKEQYVNADEAISSGALPAGMARLAYEALGLGNAAADVYRLYTPGQSVSEYVAAMDEAISIAADVSKREAFDKSETVQDLSAEQRDFAWSFGQQQRTEKQESRKANKGSKRKPAKAGTVSFDGVTINGTTYKATSKDKVKAADLRVIERIAKAANVNVVFYESDSIDGMYQGANGFYRNGTVYLDVHAAASKTTQQDAILLTAAHELTHHIRLNAEAQYDALKEFVIEHLLEQGQDFETMVQDKLKDKGMSRADAVEEVIADACEMVLKDSKAVEKLAKENKSLAQTIADWLHGFYEDIKAAFEGVEARSKEAKAMTDYMDELVKLWDDALIEASKGESKQSGKTKYSVRETSDGIKYAWLDNDITREKPADKSLPDFIYTYISDRYSKDGITKGFIAALIGSGLEVHAAQRTKKGNGLAEEYIGSTYSMWIKSNKNYAYRAKMKAAGVLNDLVSVSKVRDEDKSPKVKHKHNKDAKYASLADSYFAYEAIDTRTGEKHINAYKCQLVLLHATDGKTYLYDVKDIELAKSLAKKISLQRDHAADKNESSTPLDKRPPSKANVEIITQEAVKSKDKAYLTAVESGDMATAQRMVDEAAKQWGAFLNNPEANEVFKQSGEVREFYHGTNTGNFTVFDKALIGNSSGDLGWFGKGFYFAFSAAEARTYGGRVLRTYLKMQKPYDYSQLYRFKGSDKGASEYKRFAWLYNIVRQFPDIVDDQKVYAYPDDAEEGHPVTWRQLAGWMDRILKEAKFSVEQVKTPYGETVWELRANPKQESYTNDEGETFTWTEYGMYQTFATEEEAKEPINQIGAYLVNVMGIDSIPRRTIEKLDFSGAVQRAGYDGIIQSPYGDEAVVFEPSQIKLSDPVTYDDSGNVIPLSKRFSENNPDIRYSRRDSSEGLTKEEARAQAQAYTRLKAENAALQRRLEHWQGQTRRTKQRTINRGDVDKYARQLIKMHGSTVDPDWLKQKLREMGDYLVQTEDLDYSVLNQMAWEISSAVIENAEAEDDSAAYDVSNEILNDFKGTTFHLNEMYKNDLPEGFRKQYRGKLKISFTEGRSVDSVYEELQESYGKTLFPDMPTQADMLVIIADVYDTVSAPPAMYNPYQYHMNEAITSVSYDILDMMMSEDIRQTAPTMADKADAKLQRQKAEDRQRLNQVRADKNARIAEIRREETAKRQEAVAKEKAAKWEKRDALKAYYQDMIKRQRETRKENAAAKKHRDNVYDKATTLMNWLIKNSDKEHVPEALKAPLIDFLSSIDLTSKQKLKGGEATFKDNKYVDALEAIQRLAANQQKYLESGESTETLDMFLDFGDLADFMVDHRDAIKEILQGKTDVDTVGAIAYMNSAQLQDLDHILTVLTTAIRKANKFLTDSHYASVIEASKAARAAVDAMKPDDVRRILGKEGADRFLAWSNTIPYYAFKRFGEAGSERFEAFIMGWAKMAMNIKAIQDFTKNVYDAEQVKAWEGEIHDFEIRGQKFSMSTAQIMGLYCSSKREQALKHLDVGGMRIGNIETKGKLLKQSIQQKDTVHLNPIEMTEVLSVLSDEQIKVADELQKFMNTTCSAWGNEVSMERFGYRQFTESNYYPIKSVEQNLDLKDTKAEETSLFRLINMSATKALNPNANNAILINSIFDVFAAHSADMAKYNGLALPVLDMVKWYNYREKSFNEFGHMDTFSVHKSIEASFGTNATRYIGNFIKDLNGVRSGGRDEGLLKGFMGRYKAAAVALNTRVIVQQPTSIVRAAYMINSKYLMQGATMKGGVKEAMEYSGLAQWKSMGFFDTNIARGVTEQIKGAGSAVDKARDLSMKGAEKADEITWGTIWNACKLEQMDKGLEGKALMEATTRRFNEVIVSTQVMDSTITRSDLMRSDSLMMKELTSFKSEPTVSYNILLDSAMELILEYKRTGSITEARKRAWPFMWRAGMVYVTGQIATAAAAAIVDALRDDDEYQDYISKWLEHLKQNIIEGANPINLLPILGEAINIALGKETHDSMLFQPLTQLSKAATAAQDLWRTWFNSEQELNDPNRTNWGRLYQIAQAVSSISGLPVAGGMREFKTVWNMSGRLVTGKALKNYDSDIKNDVKYALQDGYIDEEKAIALLTDSGEYDDPDDAYWQVQEWLHADDSEWTRYTELDNAMLAGNMNAFKAAQESLGDHGIEPRSVRTHAKGQIEKWFVGEGDIPAKINEGTALDYLQKFAGLTKIESQHLIDEWKFEKATGFKWSELKDEYVKGTFDDKTTQGYLINYGHEYSKDAAEKVREWKCEKETGVAFSELCDAFVHGEITADQTQKYLVKYGGESEANANAKVAQWELVNTLGIKYSSTDAGIKKALIEGYISDETAKAAMVTVGGKTWEEAEDYVNQYHFTEETGYAWSEIEEAYADGIITYEEMIDWFERASIYTHGSREIAEEYARVAEWKKNIPDADSINRTALEKWDTKGDYMQRAGLNEVDFADAWSLYSESYAQYDANGNKVKEKAEVFFEKLYNLHKQGVYTEREIDAIARTVYSKGYVNKYAMW